MSVLAITYSFSPDTTIFSNEVNQNFNDIAVWANGHIDQTNLAVFNGAIVFSIAGSDAALNISTSSSSTALNITSSGPASPIVVTDTGTSGAIPAFKIASTTRGSMPMPVMSGAQRAAITSPPDGLMVFDTDDEAPYWYADGAWHFPQSSGVNNLLGVVNTTVDYTALTTDNVIEADATSAAITITLPAATTSGLNYTIIKMDAVVANPIAILGTIGGVLNPTLNTQQESVQIVSNGTDWDVLSHTSNTPWVQYTPSSIPQATSSVNFWWRRIGANLEIRGFWVATAAGAASPAIIPFPSTAMLIDPLVIASLGTNYNICGQAALNTSSMIFVIAGGGDHTFEFCSAGLTQIPQNASTLFPATGQVSLTASFPIQGWT